MIKTMREMGIVCGILQLTWNIVELFKWYDGSFHLRGFCKSVLRTFYTQHMAQYDAPEIEQDAPRTSQVLEKLIVRIKSSI